MYESHDMRYTGFRKLTVVNGTPGFWGVTPTMPSLQYSKETVDTILDDEFVISRDGGFRSFLVKWHGRPDSDATWI